MSVRVIRTATFENSESLAPKPREEGLVRKAETLHKNVLSRVFIHYQVVDVGPDERRFTPVDVLGRVHRAIVPGRATIDRLQSYR